MAVPAWLEDPYRRQLEVRVDARGRDEDGPWVRLDRSILYPEGGGQPADRGLLAGVPVLDVQRRDGEVRHYLAEELPAAAGRAVESGTLPLVLDWPRRFDHMQQHTAQHLLTAIAADRFGWPTTAFHLGAERSDVELDVAELDERALEELEDAVAEEVRRARPVRERFVEREELEGLGERVRSRSLPEGLDGPVRLVEIEGIDLATCGGTHLRSTAEIETVELLGTERLRGGTRLHWLAGGRVRARLRSWEKRGGDLRRLLGAADEELVGAVELKLEQLRAAERRLRQLEEERAEQLARELASGGERAIVRRLDGWGPAALQLLARRFHESAASGVLVASGGSESERFFVVAVGGGSSVAAETIGPSIAAAFGGRGGGRGALYQGKGSVTPDESELRRLLERG